MFIVPAPNIRERDIFLSSSIIEYNCIMRSYMQECIVYTFGYYTPDQYRVRSGTSFGAKNVRSLNSIAIKED
jgi:hypothetical protein